MLQYGLWVLDGLDTAEEETGNCHPDVWGSSVLRW